MSYQSTLASNFPADCRIPHLENNHYIYGAGPLHKPSPMKYPSGCYSAAKDDQGFQSRSSFHNLSPYSYSRSNKSTNPYTIPTNDSPSTGLLVQKTNELRDKRLGINERESRIFHTPENASHLNYEKFESNDSYSNIHRSAIPVNGKDSVRIKQSTNTMQEFQLFQGNSDPQHLRYENRAIFEEVQRKHYEEVEKSRRIQEIERNARAKRDQDIEREKQELEHFQAIKKSEELEREREKEEYHKFLMKKQEEVQILERQKERTQAELLRKLQIEQEIQRQQAEEVQRKQAEEVQRKQAEEVQRAQFERAQFERAQFERAQLERAQLERAQLERAELLRQEEIRKAEYDLALQAKMQEDFERAELEKALLRRRLEESAQAENERVLQQRNQEIQRAEYENERRRRDQLQKAELEDRRRPEALLKHKKDEPIDHQRLSQANRSRFNERQLALKEEIGRESRQFCREKNLAYQRSPEKNKINSPNTVNKDPSQPSSEGKTKVSNSKSLKEKIRSLSARKNEPHYHQPTFSTKVKSMGNQSYKFAGAYRTGFK